MYFVFLEKPFDRSNKATKCLCIVILSLQFSDYFVNLFVHQLAFLNDVVDGFSEFSGASRPFWLLLQRGTEVSEYGTEEVGLVCDGVEFRTRHTGGFASLVKCQGKTLASRDKSGDACYQPNYLGHLACFQSSIRVLFEMKY